MATREPIRSQFPTPPSNSQRLMRVDPFAPLPTSSPLAQQQAGESASWPEEVQMNSMPTATSVPRTSSRKRRVSATGSGSKNSQNESYTQPPAAPEVPRAPPISYRGPYTDNGTSPTIGNSMSFAARVQGFARDDDPIPADNPLEPQAMAQSTPNNRRRSVDHPSRIANANSSDRRRETEPSRPPATIDGIPVQQSTSAKVPKRHEGSKTVLPQPEVNPPVSESQRGSTTAPVRSSTRLSSTGATDPRTEWAPDRSPLQKLEVKLIDISKEEKRARVEKAERRLRERKAEEGSRRKDDGVPSNTKRVLASGAAGGTVSQSRTVVPEGSPGPNSQHNETGSSHRPIAPAYVEDIDQQQLERQQPRLIQKGPPVSARSATRDSDQKSQKASPNVSTPRKQSVRGVRFQGGGTGDRLNEVTPYAGQESPRPQQMIRQNELDNGARHSKEVPSQQQALYSSKLQPSGDTDDPVHYGGASDPVPRNSVRTQNHANEYQVPPQTAAGIEARQKVGFGGDPGGAIAAPAQRHKHHLSKILHHGHRNVPNQVSGLETQPRQLDEWRQGGTARLTAADLVNESEFQNDQQAWWEGRKSGGQGNTSVNPPGRGVGQSAMDGSYSEDYGLEKRSFNPPLYLKCGPLLRYTGLKRDRLQNPRTEMGTSTIERETWRGSVMIVTIDAESQYSPAPSLRLFSEPIDLLPPPPQEINGGSGHSLPPEYVDPIAGLPKLTRTGNTVYVKPAEDLEQEADLSRVETDDGLFEETRTANVPTSYGMPNSRTAQKSQAQSGKSRVKRRERAGYGPSVTGVRLHAERGVTFWRFNLEVELTARQSRIAYSINRSPSVGFWVPARGQSMNVMFHSCNGFSMSVNPAVFSGPDPLWRDVLNSHQTRPFHVMIGGGDQIYNDAVMSQTKLFREWLELKNPHHKHEATFSLEMQEELETFYLERYSMWFSQGLFGMANSQIPMVNMWDDHDIIDGFGSYPHHFMSTPVFCGLGAVAFKYYMLFQQQSVPGEGTADESSWLLGAAPGPYINELSRSIFLSLGKNVAFLALDCRTERMRDEVVSEATYDLVLDRCRRELTEGETKHLIVLLGVPIAYPRLVWLENLLTSRVMDPVKALSRAGMLGGFLNKFDGGVEILDDLDDHWTAKNHKRERNYFIQELQELASEKSVRVTILGGDVHLAAVGQFFSNPKLKIPKDRDHRYMANVISSAIVNTPPPVMMGDILNKRNKTHHLDHDTDENMIPMFTHDVDGKPRNNKRLLPRRNWCSIREYLPGSTPPPTPSDSGTENLDGEPLQRPGVLQRTLSLTRADIKPGNLIRRLSQRDNQPSAEYPLSNEYRGSPTAAPSSPEADGYFAAPPKRQSGAGSTANGITRFSSAPLPRPGNFHRRPTNMSFKAVRKGGAVENDDEDHINLENGLDIVLNCEVSQKDPAGITVPYRLLIPALLYEGQEDVNDAGYRKKSLAERFGSFRGGKRRSLAGNQGQGNWGKSQDSFTQTDSQSERSEQRLQNDAMGSGGTLGRLKRSLSSRGKKRVPQAPQEGVEEGRVEGMSLFQRRASVVKRDISAPQLQGDTVSAEVLSAEAKGGNGFATARAPPNPQRQTQGRTSNVSTTVTGGQAPQRQSSGTNRVEGTGTGTGTGISPRRPSTTAQTQPPNPLRSQPQSAQQSQPLGLRMMEDRAEQQRQQSSGFEHADNGYPSRRLSKLDRLLGVGHTRDQGTGGGGASFAARDAARRDEEYSTEGGYSDDYSYEESIEHQEGAKGGNPGPARGYGGIEAYKEGKGWKRLLGAKGKALFE